MTGKFRVVCYVRVEAGTVKDAPMTWGEANQERKNLQAMQPENFYVIEEVSP